jgi:hypothetical protein
MSSSAGIGTGEAGLGIDHPQPLADCPQLGAQQLAEDATIWPVRDRLHAVSRRPEALEPRL